MQDLDQQTIRVQPRQDKPVLLERSPGGSLNARLGFEMPDHPQIGTVELVLWLGSGDGRLPGHAAHAAAQAFVALQMDPLYWLGFSETDARIAAETLSLQLMLTRPDSDLYDSLTRAMHAAQDLSATLQQLMYERPSKLIITQLRRSA